MPSPFPGMDPYIEDLNATLATVYEHGGYATLIDYHQPPPPPKLDENNVLWLDEYLCEQEAR